MTKTIDVDAVINSILLTDQGSNPSAPGAGKKQLFSKASGLYFIDSGGAVSGPLGNFLIPGGRLTLTSGTAVTTADVTAATTIWYQPKDHNICPVWDGSKVIPLEFNATPLSLSGLSGTSTFDVFGYSNAGTFALESAMWTSPTTRAVPLIYQSGRLVKSGTPTRTYLGSFYSTTGGQTDDSVTKRNVWNYYNRVLRYMYKADGTSHTYATTTYRSWNNDAAIRLEFVQGVLEDVFTTSVAGDIAPSGAGVQGYISIGLDVTNANSLNLPVNTFTYRQTFIQGADSRLPSAAGFHFLQALEYASNTVTFAEVYIRAQVWA